MMMISFIFLTIFASTALGQEKPHLFTVVIDDLGWTDLGVHGSEFTTPVLDELIKTQSILLNRYYVAPTCSPSRSSFITGMQSISMGLQPIYTIPQCMDMGIPFKNPTVAEALKTKGYQTHAYGKWHLGYYNRSYTPIHRGFDTFVGQMQGASSYYDHELCDNPNNFLQSEEYEGHEDFCGFDWWIDDDLDFSAVGRYVGDIVEESVTTMINAWSPGDKPIYAYLSFQVAHAPFHEPPKMYADCDDVFEFDQRHLYCNQIKYLDEILGRFVDLLKSKGMWDNSYVMFTTDNGGMPTGAYPNLPLVNGAGYNAPLRAGKGTVFDGGVRVRAWLTGGMVPESLRGTENNNLYHGADIVGGQLANVGLPIDHLDGIDMYKELLEGGKGRDVLIIDLHSDEDFPPSSNAMIKRYDGKLYKYMEVAGIHMGDMGYDGWWTNVTGPRIWPEDKCWQMTGGCLFNIEDDEIESKNLKDSKPEIYADLKGLLTAAKLVENGYVPHQLYIANPDCVGATIERDIWMPWDMILEEEEEKALKAEGKLKGETKAEKRRQEMRKVKKPAGAHTQEELDAEDVANLDVPLDSDMIKKHVRAVQSRSKQESKAALSAQEASLGSISGVEASLVSNTETLESHGAFVYGLSLIGFFFTVKMAYNHCKQTKYSQVVEEQEY